MRFHILAALVIGAASATTIHAQGVSSIELAVTPPEASAPVYAASPRGDAEYLFFVGERLQLHIDLGNPHGSAVQLNVPIEDVKPSAWMQIDVRKSDRQIPVRTTFGQVEFQGMVDGQAPRPSNGLILFKPGQRLTVSAELSGLTEPGIYVLEARAKLVDEINKPIARARFVFELRSSDDESRLEILRQRSIRAFDSGDLVDAEKWARQLSKIHPKSYVSVEMLGHIAAAKGQKDEASALFRRAAEIVENDGDTEYTRRAHPEARVEEARRLRTHQTSQKKSE